jgi:hypothetical protein
MLFSDSGLRVEQSVEVVLTESQVKAGAESVYPTGPEWHGEILATRQKVGGVVELIPDVTDLGTVVTVRFPRPYYDMEGKKVSRERRIVSAFLADTKNGKPNPVETRVDNCIAVPVNILRPVE